MKVCHITSAHRLDDVRIYLKECKSLSKKHEVILLGNDRNFNEHDDKNESVKKINLHVEHNSRIRKMLKLHKEIKKIVSTINADVYHLHDPDLLLIAKYLKSTNKIVIFDSHEDTEKQILAKAFIPIKLRKPVSIIYSYIQAHVLKRIDGVVTATPIIKENLEKYNSNIEDIKNYPILKEFEVADIKNINKREQVIYVGGLALERGLIQMIKAANRLPNVDFLFCGNFESKTTEEKARKLIEKNNISFTGYIDRESIVNNLLESSVGLVLLEANQRYRESLPIKMFEYMAAGIPVIASNFPLWKEILEESNAGVCVDEQNIDEIVSAIQTILKNKTFSKEQGVSGREFVFREYNWYKEEVKLLEFYSNLEEKK